MIDNNNNMSTGRTISTACTRDSTIPPIPPPSTAICEPPSQHGFEPHGFLASAEDIVYETTGFIKQDAKVVEGLAQNVEKMASLVEEEANNVEKIVHEVNLKTQEMEDDVSRLDEATQALVTNPSQIKTWSNFKSDIMDTGWGWTIFRIFLALLTLFVMLHNARGVNVNLSSSPQSNGSSPKVTFTLFNMFLINLGPVIKILNMARSTLSQERKILTKIEEDVDEVAEEVIQASKVVKGISHLVEESSEQVEQEANHLQSLIHKN